MGISQKDIAGKKFGEWTAIRYAERVGSNYFWLCRCSCGSEKNVKKSSLISGKTKSCGCSMAKSISGKEYGKFKAISLEKKFRGRDYWFARCLTCGDERRLEKSYLKSGKMTCWKCKEKARKNDDDKILCETRQRRVPTSRR